MNLMFWQRDMPWLKDAISAKSSAGDPAPAALGAHAKPMLPAAALFADTFDDIDLTTGTINFLGRVQEMLAGQRQNESRTLYGLAPTLRAADIVLPQGWQEAKLFTFTESTFTGVMKRVMPSGFDVDAVALTGKRLGEVTGLPMATLPNLVLAPSPADFHAAVAARALPRAAPDAARVNGFLQAPSYALQSFVFAALGMPQPPAYLPDDHVILFNPKDFDSFKADYTSSVMFGLPSAARPQLAAIVMQAILQQNFLDLQASPSFWTEQGRMAIFARFAYTNWAIRQYLQPEAASVAAPVAPSFWPKIDDVPVIPVAAAVQAVHAASTAYAREQVLFWRDSAINAVTASSNKSQGIDLFAQIYALQHQLEQTGVSFSDATANRPLPASLFGHALAHHVLRYPETLAQIFPKGTFGRLPSFGLKAKPELTVLIDKVREVMASQQIDAPALALPMPLRITDGGGPQALDAIGMGHLPRWRTAPGLLPRQVGVAAVAALPTLALEPHNVANLRGTSPDYLAHIVEQVSKVAGLKKFAVPDVFYNLSQRAFYDSVLMNKVVVNPQKKWFFVEPFYDAMMGYGLSNYGAFYLPGPKAVVMNPKFGHHAISKYEILAHELTHAAQHASYPHLFDRKNSEAQGLVARLRGLADIRGILSRRYSDKLNLIVLEGHAEWVSHCMGQNLSVASKLPARTGAPRPPTFGLLRKSASPWQALLAIGRWAYDTVAYEASNEAPYVDGMTLFESLYAASNPSRDPETVDHTFAHQVLGNPELLRNVYRDVPHSWLSLGTTPKRDAKLDAGVARVFAA